MEDLEKLYYNMRYDIQRIDLAKYVILYLYGGIYIDLDIHIIESLTDIFNMKLFNMGLLLVRWDNSKLPYNAIMGSLKGHKIILEIIKACKTSYNEKSQMEIYKKWRGRFVYQTTGHYMIQRVLKNNKITKENLNNILYVKSKGKIIKSVSPIFYDTNESIWYNKSVS